MTMAVSWYQSRSFVAQSEHCWSVKMCLSKWRAFSTAWRQGWRVKATAKLEQDLPERFLTCTCRGIVHWYPFELRKPVMRTRTRVVRLLSHFSVSAPVQFRLLNNNNYGSSGPYYYNSEWLLPPKLMLVATLAINLLAPPTGARITTNVLIPPTCARTRQKQVGSAD